MTLTSARDQAERPTRDCWPHSAWPDVTTHFVLCTRDRFFPAAFMRGVVFDRLGIEADETDAGHLPMLARPAELAELLVSYL